MVKGQPLLIEVKGAGPTAKIDLRHWSPSNRSFLTHSSDIDDLLEGLDGVLEDWLDGLHDTESSLHIIDLWLHALSLIHI